MTRTIAFVGLLGLLGVFGFGLVPAASAATAAQKMDTCKFGADDQKLDGAKRKAFMAKCMSKKDDPRGPAEKKN
jgi:psiF repeat